MNRNRTKHLLVSLKFERSGTLEEALWQPLLDINDDMAPADPYKARTKPDQHIAPF
jgi:hypothetical protein